MTVTATPSRDARVPHHAKVDDENSQQMSSVCSLSAHQREMQAMLAVSTAANTPSPRIGPIVSRMDRTTEA